MNILWICDVRGWAFDNESRCVSRGMPDSTHWYAYSRTDDRELVARCAEVADAIIVHSVQGMKLIPRALWGKVLLRITGIRALMEWKR